MNDYIVRTSQTTKTDSMEVNDNKRDEERKEEFDSDVDEGQDVREVDVNGGEESEEGEGDIGGNGCYQPIGWYVKPDRSLTCLSCVCCFVSKTSSFWRKSSIKSASS